MICFVFKQYKSRLVLMWYNFSLWEQNFQNKIIIIWSKERYFDYNKTVFDLWVGTEFLGGERNVVEMINHRIYGCYYEHSINAKSSYKKVIGHWYAPGTRRDIVLVSTRSPSVVFERKKCDFFPRNMCGGGLSVTTGFSVVNTHEQPKHSEATRVPILDSKDWGKKKSFAWMFMARGGKSVLPLHDVAISHRRYVAVTPP